MPGFESCDLRQVAWSLCFGVLRHLSRQLFWRLNELSDGQHCGFFSSHWRKRAGCNGDQSQAFFKEQRGVTLSGISPAISFVFLQHLECFVEMAHLTSRTPCKTLRSSEKRTCFVRFLVPVFLSSGYWIDQWFSVLTDLLGMKGKQWEETERSLLPLSLNLKEIQRGMLNIKSIFWWRVRWGK